MSKIAVSSNASGTGTFTIASPNSNTDRTLTLPNETGTIITSASSGGVSQSMLATGVAGTGPAFSAYAGSAQTVTLGTVTKIAIDTEFFDTNNNFDPTTNYRFTPTVAGYYQVNGILRGTSATTFSGIAVFLYKNGSNFRRGSEISGTLTAGGACQVLFSEVIYLNGSTDYIELYGLLNGTGTATFGSSNSISCSAFSASLVRAA